MSPTSARRPGGGDARTLIPGPWPGRAGFCAAALVLLLVAVAGTAAGGGERTPADRTRAFLDGVAAYEAGNYDRAVSAFSGLVEDGVRNGILYYDLGNAYLKAGQLGPAILWYERAATLNPNDPDLRYNLEYARGLTRDEVPESAADLGRVLFFWKRELGEPGVRWAALVLNAAAWSLFLLGWLTRRRGFRRAGLTAGALAAVFAATALFDYHRAASAAEAVVLPPEAVVRSGLTDDSTELFRLHAGARVWIDRTRGDRARITFTADKVGWIARDAVERIRLGAAGPG